MNVEENNNNQMNSEKNSRGGSPWYVALNVLSQMRRDALRADCKTVSLALSVLANHGRWEEAIRTFSYFANLQNENSSNNNGDNNAQEEIKSATAANNQQQQPQQKSLSKMNIGKFSGVGVKMDSICVGAVIRSCLAASPATKTSSFNQSENDKNNTTNNNKAEEFITNLRAALRNKKQNNNKTVASRMEPGKNPAFSKNSSNNQNSRTSAADFGGGVTNAVDEATIDAAIDELRSVAVEMEREMNKNTMLTTTMKKEQIEGHHITKTTTTKTKTKTKTTMGKETSSLLLPIEGVVDEQEHEQITHREGEEQEEEEDDDDDDAMMVMTVMTVTVMVQRRQRQVLNEWNSFFEKVGNKK